VIRSKLQVLVGRFMAASRVLGRLGVVVVGSVLLLLAFTGFSFADGNANISTVGASATVSVAQAGVAGSGAKITVSNIQVTKSGCYYVKYDLKIQGTRDQNGKHVGKNNFCFGKKATSRSVDINAYVGLVPWVEGATVRVCKDVERGADTCGQPTYLTAWGHNGFRP
jgi:hypothetical protein